jgi:Dolichyl-phosphate-mannose-protein mannosyltransferase
VTRAPAFLSRTSPTARLLLVLVPAALIGLYGRFKGIGTWPLGVDEFYISRSVDHVLTSGLPVYPCGGYYTRALLFQYLVAILRMSGLSPEFAGRFIAAVCSLAVLPAAYLLGKRVQGPLAGWLSVIILLISIWEIEMARFGRMYAPFQAVFAWYLFFFLRYTIDKNAAALRWMIGLSLVGVLTWEGGALLGVANIYAVVRSHDHGRIKAADWRRLAGLGVLLVLLYLASRDLRDLGAAPAEAAAPAGASHSIELMIVAFMSAVRLHWPWVIAFLLPLGLAAAAVPFIWSHRHQWMVFAGLLLVSLSAFAHAFTATAGLLALLLLTDLIDWRELTSGRARPFCLALLALLAFWVAYDLSSGGPSFGLLFGFPDIFERIGRPWGRTLPVLTLGILLCVAYWFVRSTATPGDARSPMNALLGLLFLVVLVVASVPTDRIETRYTFFLYPVLVVIVVSAILELAGHFHGRRPMPSILLAAAPLLFFAATEDWQLNQVAHIDSEAVNFRVGMPPARAAHYTERNDMRSIAQWLTAHVQPGDVVVSGIPNLDQYYGGIDYFYLDDQDNRYGAYVCGNGRTERWTNHPILQQVDALKSAVDSGHHVYGTFYGDVEARVLRDIKAQGWSMTQVYTALDGKTNVISIEAHDETSRKN